MSKSSINIGGPDEGQEGFSLPVPSKKSEVGVELSLPVAAFVPGGKPTPRIVLNDAGFYSPDGHEQDLTKAFLSPGLLKNLGKMVPAPDVSVTPITPSVDVYPEMSPKGGIYWTPNAPETDARSAYRATQNVKAAANRVIFDRITGEGEPLVMASPEDFEDDRDTVVILPNKNDLTMPPPPVDYVDQDAETLPVPQKPMDEPASRVRATIVPGPVEALKDLGVNKVKK